MKTKKLRKGEYLITIGSRTFNLINDICMDTGKNQGWNMYENDEWMGCSNTKKQLIKMLKNTFKL